MKRKLRNKDTYRLGKYSSDYGFTNRSTKTAIDFRLQLGRDQVRTAGMYPEAHEQRFSYLYEPCKILSSYHTQQVPNFSKSKGRDRKSSYHINMTLKDYSPSQPVYLQSLRSGCNVFINISY